MKAESTRRKVEIFGAARLDSARAQLFIESSPLQRPGTVTLEVPRGMESIRAVLPNSLHRRGALEKSFQRARDATVEGDYFEFGLYRGSAFAHAVRVARRHLPASPMRFFGFDSFQGLPPLTGIDKTTGEFRQGQFACALHDVRAKLDGKVDWSRVHLVEGWFEDSLTQALKDRLRPAPVAVTLIDCDLYRSTLSVLAFLEDLLQEGSMLLFDDWDCFGRQDHMGERRAFREFLEERPWFTPEKWIRFGRRGQAFIMHVEAQREQGSA